MCTIITLLARYFSSSTERPRRIITISFSNLYFNSNVTARCSNGVISERHSCSTEIWPLFALIKLLFYRSTSWHCIYESTITIFIIHSIHQEQRGRPKAILIARTLFSLGNNSRAPAVRYLKLSADSPFISDRGGRSVNDPRPKQVSSEKGPIDERDVHLPSI